MTVSSSPPPRRIKLFSFSVLALAAIRVQLKPTTAPAGTADKASLLRNNKTPIDKIHKATTNASITIQTDAKNRTNHSASEQQLDWFNSDDLAGSKKVPCGWHKCFFRSESNRQVGYLVARSTGMSSSEKRKRLKSLDSAYNLAKYLEQEYNIRHFLIAPPTSLTVDKSLESRMNSNLKSETNRRNFNQQRFPKGSVAFVEKVKPAPRHALLVGCKESKRNLFHKVVNKFVSRVKKKEAFTRQFTKSFTELREVLLHEPCLLYDFQVLIDTKGNLYHLDFDRCFSTKSAKKKDGPCTKKLSQNSCFKSLSMIEQQVYDAIDKQQVDAKHKLV